MHCAPKTSVIPVNDIAESSDGGPIPVASTSDGGRLTGAAPQPRQDVTYPRLLCAECGSDQIHATAWVVLNTNELLNDESPTDQIWCPDCEADVSTIDDYGHGFELWREAEWSGQYPTFAEALAEAKKSNRPFEIAGAATPEEQEPILRCAECGSDDVWLGTVRHANTGQEKADENRCGDCGCDCATVEDFGFGFELRRNGELVGHFATFAEALAATDDDSFVDIVGARAEVTR
ncbi:MAG: hypothetical protein IT381_24085 [Deltaproteobacteria bacterium]|nr:hypothetical protein [Deltaproteobacteria bacterium]